MEIYKKIKDSLIESGKSQTWLSKVTNISLPKLNASLNGKRRINVKEFELIVHALNVDANELIKK